MVNNAVKNLFPTTGNQPGKPNNPSPAAVFIVLEIYSREPALKNAKCYGLFFANSFLFSGLCEFSKPNHVCNAQSGCMHLFYYTVKFGRLKTKATTTRNPDIFPQENNSRNWSRESRS